jgi:cytochrome c553
MKQTSLIFFLSLLIAFAASAEENSATAKLKAQTCAACHGETGNSIVATYPKIAGQNQRYFVKQMLDFKQSKTSGRNNPVMQSIVANLSLQDIKDLAAYFSTQKPTHDKATSNYVKQGEAIYNGGVMNTGVPACLACHAPTGAGNSEGGIPMLAGQHADYIALQLQAYKTGQRQNSTNHIMETIASKLTDEQIKAVASYIAGLH